MVLTPKALVGDPMSDGPRSALLFMLPGPQELRLRCVSVSCPSPTCYEELAVVVPGMSSPQKVLDETGTNPSFWAFMIQVHSLAGSCPKSVA